MHIESDKDNSLNIIFGLFDETNKERYVPVKIRANITGYSHEEDYWIKEKDFRHFIVSLKDLNSNLIGQSSITASNSKNDFSLSLCGEKKYRGYLQVRTSFNSKSSDSRGLVINTIFEGGFYSEPANLSHWIEELIDVLNKSE